MATFEEACHTANKMLTADCFRRDGVQPTLMKAEYALSFMGWSFATLADEGARRMRERIEQMKLDEARPV